MNTVQNLDSDLDQLISSLPEELFHLPEHKARRDNPFSTRPAEVSKVLRPLGGIHPIVDGLCGPFPLPNLFGHSEDKPRFLITGYRAYTAVMQDSEGFSASRGEEFAKAVGEPIAIMDLPEHTRLRRLLNNAFGRTAMPEVEDKIVKPIVRYLVARVALRLKEGKRVEFMRDLAVPTSYLIISELLGFPRRYLGRLVPLGNDFFAADHPERMATAVAEITSMFEAELADRRNAPREDLISWLASAEVDGERLTDEEVLVNGRFLVPAGVETTSRQLLMMAYVILSERNRFQQVVDDPTLVEPTVDEVLRWMPIQFVGSAPRIAKRDSTVEGTPIPEGSSLMTAPGMINRDPERWEHPDEFDIARERKVNITFGRGFHQCLGMHLARLEMITLLNELAFAIPDLRLGCSAEEIEILGLPTRQAALGLPLAIGS